MSNKKILYVTKCIKYKASASRVCHISFSAALRNEHEGFLQFSFDVET
ncbi:hypothetical protein SAMN05428978_1002152 [Nitrosomonas sp. Nm34]|nr:hypothetical protein SAMN05428978_1002152 [Nitrosomonas sp. Nm34]